MDLSSDNLSANWASNIRAIAQANRASSSRPRPTPATSTGSRATSDQSQKFVFNKPTTPTAQRAVDDYITRRNGTDRDRRIAALERKHRIAA